MVFCFTFCIFCISFAQSQPNLGSLSGIIKDDEGEVAIQAHIILQHIESENIKFQTITNETGFYKIENIAFGNYTLFISYLGKTKSQKIAFFESTKTVDAVIDISGLLDEVVIETKTENRQQEEKPIPIESIEIKSIENQIKDVGEAIDRVSGVRVRASGSFGDKADIAVNGLNGTAIRSYINGLPLEFIYPNLGLTNLPINSIERIDVYKGVLPIDIGTDAMGGGINLITKDKDYNEIKAFYGYGSFNTHQLGANLNFKVKEGITASFNTAYNYSDNNFKTKAFVWEENEEQTVKRFHDAYQLLFLEGKIAITNKKWADKFVLSLNYIDSYKEIQHGSFLARTAFGQANYSGNNFTLVADYNKKLSQKIDFKTAISYSFSNVVFTDTTANVYSWSGNVIAHLPASAGEYEKASLTDRDFQTATNRSSLLFKVSKNDEILVSNVAAYQTTEGRNELIENSEKDFLTHSQTLFKNILGIQYNRKFFNEKLILSAAAKLYLYDLQGVESLSLTPLQKDGKDIGWYGTAKYQVNKNLFFRASYEHALRIPLFTQFFGNGAAIVSNIALTPETSDNFNLGFSYRKTISSKFAYGIDVNGFLRNQNDLIYLTPSDVQRYDNAEEVDTKGIEVDFFLRFFQNWKIKGNTTYLSKTYASIDLQNAGAQFLIGTDFPNTPRFFSNLQLEYNKKNIMTSKDRFYGYLRYVFIDEFNFLNQGQIYDAANYIPVQHRLDIGVAYSLLNDRITIALNANNIFNNEVFDNFSIPKPMRNYNMKVTYLISDF